jgi:uncharacterized protein
MTAYKVPGVYVEEISKFPPSIAEVETAIPAFIGYTQFANKDGISLNSPLPIPTKIKSMLEYEIFFGEGASFVIENVDGNTLKTEGINVKIVPQYYMYDSLQLYFANGGGDCYIVSVGNYPSSVAADDLKKGITALELYDEPTLLLFPDAVILGQDDLSKVQQAAIKQCADLMDRFAILDTLKTDELGAGFKDKLGMTHLKYAAAYTPWLKASLSKKIVLSNIKDGFKKIKEQTGTTLVGLIGIKDFIDNYEKLVLEIAKVKTDNDLIKKDGLYSTKYVEILGDGATAKAKKAIEYIYDIAVRIEKYTKDTAIIANAEFQKFIIGNIIPVLDEKLSLIFTKNNVAKPAIDISRWPLSEDPALVLGGSAPDSKLCTDLLNDGTLDAIFAALDYMEVGMNANIQSIEQTLIENIPFYKNLLQVLNKKMTELPPSGAIAGLYCATDNSRGVWKAPANISINSVSGVTKQFSQPELAGLNIDAVAGKSINVIRPITGQGIIVMGGRTLAGNDNEWRYIPVRRFFNFVEESTKKSTMWAIFEPNDANLWLRVKTMIENFLYNLWRRGALAGAKPEHAFYVRCGLGLTMTAQDILEGKMVVEIGMAAVRPAEFIVLKFSHKLQES